MRRNRTGRLGTVGGMTRGLPPAPRWAWVVMALGVAAIVVLSYLTLNRPPPPRFEAPASAAATSAPRTSPASRPAATSTPAETTSPAQARILVVGDAFSAPPAPGGGWPELVAGDLRASGRPVEMVVAASDLAGYAEPDAQGVTLAGLAQQAGSGFDLVVFFGSRNDIAAAADVQAAATAAFAAARGASPDAALLVIGPTWPGIPPGYIVTNRDAVAAAAVPTGAVFVDPLTAGWFTGQAAAFLVPDGTRPTAEGQRYLADLIGPAMELALPDSG